MKEDWQGMMFDFLRGRPTLRRVLLLMDSRVESKPADRAAMDLLGEAAVAFQLVLTKADGGKPAQLQSGWRRCRRSPDGTPRLIPWYSSPAASPGRALRNCGPRWRPSRRSDPDGEGAAAARTGRIRVGIAGWTFPPWRGNFFPKGLKQKDELRHASRAFTILEANGTFYSMQKPPTFAAWDEETPADFVFSMKGPRFITHMKRLKDCEAPLANFLASGVLRLGPKLGPILWQLPPNMTFEAERIEAFLALLPHDRSSGGGGEARGPHERPRLARSRPARVVRHALEARHESFADPACLDLCRKHGVALAVTDGIPDYPHFREATADFLYVRLHLNAEAPEVGYDEAIAAWAERLAGWSAEGHDVFAVFDAAGDESVKVNTPIKAAALMDRLKALGAVP